MAFVQRSSLSLSALSAPLRGVIVAQYPPALQWSAGHGQQLRVWPVVCAAVLTFVLVLALLVLSNYDTAVCEEGVVYDLWTDERRSSGCKMYDVIQDEWVPYIAVSSIPYDLNLISAHVEQDVRTGAHPLFQPTYAISRAELSPHSVQFAAITVHYKADALSVNTVAVYDFPHFSLLLLFIGTALPADAAHLSQLGLVDGDAGARLLLNSSAINRTDPLNGLNVESNVNASITSFLLQRYYAPLPAIVDGAILSTFNKFAGSRHIQHCTVCIKASPVSITWIIILGVVQAVSLINVFAGYCLRRLNSSVYAAERKLMFSHIGDGTEETGLTEGGDSTSYAPPQVGGNGELAHRLL
jgi:hypothetical protein